MKSITVTLYRHSVNSLYQKIPATEHIFMTSLSNEEVVDLED